MRAPSQFRPSPNQAARLFDLLADPSESFLSIAARFNTSLADLSLYLARPEVAERYSALEANFARRARLVATAHIPAAAASALRILDDFNASTDASPIPCPRETALRAARIVLRLANFTPGPHPVAPRPAGSRTPREFDSIPLRNTESPAFSAPSAREPQQTLRETAPRAPESTFTGRIGDETPGEQPLSDDEVLRLAEDLIRKGAFSQNEIDDAFRLAAAQSLAESNASEPAEEAIEAPLRQAEHAVLSVAPP
ncbi:MAG: hypothetical protein KF805_14210 [Phycisphaeraceae bacterium]|nr:hypothetical protein [Phycisphaeraceae bacterium]